MERKRGGDTNWGESSKSETLPTPQSNPTTFLPPSLNLPARFWLDPKKASFSIPLTTSALTPDLSALSRASVSAWEAASSASRMEDRRAARDELISSALDDMAARRA